jgi:hypothetical protein
VDDERGQVDAADRRCRALQARGDMVGKVEKDVQKCLELMREIENEARGGDRGRLTGAGGLTRR